MKYILALAMVASLSGAAEAVKLRSIIRDCSADGKTYCPKASYGKAMQSCLTTHYKKLTPACKKIVTRLNSGEGVKLF